MVAAPGGEVAGYGLFWADHVTGVGLVEPMRTEQAWQRRGIAAHLLAAGLDRLAMAGCARLKVSSDIGLYRQAGFRPDQAATAAIYARSRPAGPGGGA
jgi:predicted N-acetyltransferase YhbS